MAKKKTDSTLCRYLGKIEDSLADLRWDEEDKDEDANDDEDGGDGFTERNDDDVLEEKCHREDAEDDDVKINISYICRWMNPNVLQVYEDLTVSNEDLQKKNTNKI